MYIFLGKTIELFAWIVPVNFNYESIVDRGGYNAQSFLNMTPDEISEAAPRPVLWKKCNGNTINLINWSSFQQYYTINKSIKEVIFSKA